VKFQFVEESCARKSLLWHFYDVLCCIAIDKSPSNKNYFVLARLRANLDQVPDFFIFKLALQSNAIAGVILISEYSVLKRFKMLIEFFAAFLQISRGLISPASFNPIIIFIASFSRFTTSIRLSNHTILLLASL